MVLYRLKPNRNNTANTAATGTAIRIPKNKNFIIDLSGALEDENGKKDISKIDKLLNLSAKI